MSWIKQNYGRLAFGIIGGIYGVSVVPHDTWWRPVAGFLFDGLIFYGAAWSFSGKSEDENGKMVN